PEFPQIFHLFAVTFKTEPSTLQRTPAVNGLAVKGITYFTALIRILQLFSCLMLHIVTKLLIHSPDSVITQTFRIN
ncbi:MAG: hypothetical protein IIW08_00035, partial [Clostridia bacterium]|nr:hypothetical protein [Clostridia bacterium]